MVFFVCIYGDYLILEGECMKGKTNSILFESFISLLSLKRQSNLLYTTVWCFIFYCVIISATEDIGIETKMKSFYKAGCKYIASIFVVKERELDIGYPTEVKHLAHIGWDGQSGSAPSWMSNFRTGPEFSTTSIGNNGSALSPWSSQDFGECLGRQTADELYKDVAASPDLPNIPKSKQTRKKNKSTSCTKSGSFSSRSSRSAKSKSKFVEDAPKPLMNVQVA